MKNKDQAMNNIEKTLKACYGRSEYSELHAVYELTNEKLCKVVTHELETQLRHEMHYDQNLYIDFIWIDKAPYAKFDPIQNDINSNQILGKVELGDFAIIYRQRQVFQNKNNPEIQNLQKRAAIVQAKLTNENNPFVPIAKLNSKRVTSTSKELKLLEDWPKFHLYKASNSNEVLCRDLKVNNDSSVKALFGGFNNELKTWIFGEAKSTTKCTLRYSDLLYGMLKNSLGKSIDEKDLDWKRLFEQIELVSINRKLSKIYDKNEKSAVTRIRVCGPLEKFLRFILGKKMFLIILIDQIDYEGHEIKYLKGISTK